MSATIETLVLAWRASTPATRELVGELLRAAVELSSSLGVPAQAPGWGAPLPSLGAESTPEQVRGVLTEYERRAELYRGIPLDVLYAVRDAEGVLPTWSAVTELAQRRVGQYAVDATRRMAAAYEQLRGDVGVVGQRINDTAVRAWLGARLAAIEPRPESSGMGKLLIAGLVLYVVARATEGKT